MILFAVFTLGYIIGTMLCLYVLRADLDVTQT